MPDNTLQPEATVSLKAILNALPAMVGYWDRGLRNVIANHAYVEYFGVTPEEIRGRHISQVLGPELYALNRPYLERALAGEPQLFDREIVDASGARRFTQASYVPDVADGEVRGLVVLVTDITARRVAEQAHAAAEDALRRSRERLAEAERVARIGSWEWDVTNDHTTWSEGLYRIYGLAPDEFDPSSEGARRRVYPDDRQLVRQTLERAIAERSSFTLEYRALLADGRVHTLRSHGEVVAAESGEPIRVVGIVQDITEATLAQEALQNTSAELERRASALQQLALRTATDQPATAHAPLTARQLEILRLIAQGLTNAAIAERLVVTEGTIKWHVKQILAKTNSTNRAEAVARVLGAPG
jgi:PAS domain S-box-containing protein